jgi:hypothetical protein
VASSGICRSLASRSRPSRTRRSMVHHLHEVAVAAEDVLVVGRGLPGRVVVAVAKVHLHLAGRAARGADDPSGVLGQQLAVDAGLLEEAVTPRAGAEPEEVVHPLGRLAEQRHVGVGAACADVVAAAVVEVDALALEPAGVGRRVGLDADDRLDPRGGGLAVELVGPEHVAVVGHRHRRHPELRGPLGQLGQPCRTVEHGVLGVHVQVDERVLAGHGWGGLLTGTSGRATQSCQVVDAERRGSWGKGISLRRRPR